MQAQGPQAHALSNTGLSTSAFSITGGGSASSSGSTLRTSLAVYGAPEALAAGKAEGKAILDSLKLGAATSSPQRGVDFLPPLSETPRTDEPTSCGSGAADAELESLPAASTAASTDNATCASEVAATQWLGGADGVSITALDGSPTDLRDELVAIDESRQAVPGPPAAALRVEDLERQMVQQPSQGRSTGDAKAEATDALAKLLKLPAEGDKVASTRSEEAPPCGKDKVERSPVERRIAPESGKEYAFEELMEAWNEEYTLEDVEDYWENRMTRKAAPHEAEKPAVAEQAAEGSIEEEEQTGNSGRLLLLLLKGTQVIREPGAAGVLPERLRDERWEPLLQPFTDVNDPKRFVGADQFGPGHGVPVTGSGTQPVVLKDIPKSDILVMFKPSGWATCSTPQWEGVEGNLIRYIWQRHANCSMAAPCHRLDRGTSGAVVVAKTRNALRHIATQITSRTLVKQYFGLCHGKIEPPQGALSLPLALSSTDKPLGACAAEGRPAVTRYRVLGYFSRPGNSEDEVIFYSLVQLQIDHGRQHQIRLHMASMGHPIVYDAKYNSSCLREDAKVCSRLYLHAAFVQCSLPPDGTEMLRVACRLPQQLKQALSTLVRERSLEKYLPMEGVRLCDCLLDNEPGVSSASLFEARLAARRRNDFLKSFNFSSTEKDEVHRLLAKLPTPEERSFALLRFRVLGERTPDFIVTRFARYVDGLLKQSAQGADKSENPGQADSANVEKDALDFSSLDPMDGYGPVTYHTEHVTCEVCGALEKVDIVGFPAMQLGLRCRSLVASQASQAMPVTGPLARLLANATHAHHVPAEEPQEASGSTEEDEEDEEEEEEEAEGDKEVTDDGEAQSSDAELSAELISVLKEHGGTMNGPLVASRFASRYNKCVRKDSRRNDGSLRRWIGEQPGVSVEHCGGNRWKVHLNLESAEEEEQEKEEAAEDGVQWGQTKRGPRKAWHRNKSFRSWR